MKPRQILLSAILLFATMLVGCVVASPIQSTLLSATKTQLVNRAMPTFTATPLPTYTGTAIATHISTPTNVPTLPPDQAQTKLLELLANNDNCSLPCLWGITPGKSTYREAETILAPFSAISDSTNFSATFNTMGGVISPIYTEGDIETHTTVSFESSIDQLVTNISFKARQEQKILKNGNLVGIREIYDSKTFGKRFQPYTLSKILSEQGSPTTVLIQTFNALSSLGQRIGGGFDIVLLYPDQGLLVHYTTQLQVAGEKVRGCHLANAQIELQLYPAEHGDAFAQSLSATDWAGIWPLSANKPYWTSIEESTSMTLTQFYETFRKPTDQCIETPAKLWPAPFR